MQEHNFDDILDFLCSGIMSKSERESVRDELYDHLMCRYETNLAIGLDEEQAQKRAVDDLGDASTLRFKLGQVHSYAPKPTLKKAMNLLIFGYVLTSFHLSFFNGMKEITTFIGTVCLIVALFCFRTANKKLKAAFYLKTLLSVLSWIVYALNPIYSLPFIVSAAIGVMTNLLSPIVLILLILGIKELVIPHINSYPKKIPFGACIVLNGLWGLINIVVFGFLIDSGELNANIESIFLFCLIIISVILNLVIFVRSSRVLWNSDHEYKIEDSPAKKTVAALLAVVVAFVPTVAVDISLANQKAETSVHTIEDYEMTQSEYERITSNLLSYDIPEEIVFNLPKSEIIKYTDSINKYDYDEFILKHLEYPLYQDYSEVCNDVEAVFSVCAIGMTDSDDHPYVRILSWVEYNSEDKGYDDALFWEHSQRSLIPMNYDDEYEGDFLLILSDENGKIIKNEPLDIFTDKTAYTNRMTGVRFQSKMKLTIIHAETFGTNRAIVTNENYGFDLVHRVSQLTFFCRSHIDAKENRIRNNYLGYRTISELSMIVWGNVLSDSLEETE